MGSEKFMTRECLQVWQIEWSQKLENLVSNKDTIQLPLKTYLSTIEIGEAIDYKIVKSFCIEVPCPEY